jgi:hypothetical protein
MYQPNHSCSKPHHSCCYAAHHRSSAQHRSQTVQQSPTREGTHSPITHALYAFFNPGQTRRSTNAKHTLEWRGSN